MVVLQVTYHASRLQTAAHQVAAGQRPEQQPFWNCWGSPGKAKAAAEWPFNCLRALSTMQGLVVKRFLDVGNKAERAYTVAVQSCFVQQGQQYRTVKCITPLLLLLGL